MQRCTRCLLPETHETIVFDDNGVCNTCINQDVKRSVDWDAKRNDFEALLDEYRGKYDYDCIVPFSGGKDSTFTLWALVKEWNLKPLVVSFDHGFMRPQVIEDRNRTFRILGVDHIIFKSDWKLVQLLMRESLVRKGDFCWHCHTGIFAYPMHIALKFKIPLIIWGEPSAEYTAYYSYDQPEEVDERRFNRIVNLGINAEDMLGMLHDRPEGKWVTERDLRPFTYPDVRDLRKLRVRSVCLGSYIPWDVRRQTEVIKSELEWKGNVVEGVAPEYDYEKVECSVQGIRDYLKFTKRGYGRTAHLANIDIRNGRLEREDGLQMALEHDGKRPASLDRFLDYVGIAEEEFNQIAETQSVAPYKHDWSSVIEGDPLPDEQEFDRSAPFPRTPLIDPPRKSE
ncbi:N-acetyl sugar amidotransferase [SAR202 cluster bacterium AD-812-D07_MRT_10900m]|nr:N-acetyl sugar amidotransferase [SAR202 cluster bacterium AD-812-D07_MRT_10900m]